MGTNAPGARPIQQTALAGAPARPAAPTDAELVVRAQRGEKAAFGELVSRYQDRVYNTIYRMCHNHADSLDLSQTAFLKAYQALPRFESRANFFTWLFRIAVNLVITQRRSRVRAVVQFDGLQDESLAPPATVSANEDRAERAEDLARLAAALERLDDEFRAAVILKDIEELDYATIGEILEVPVGTVKSRIHRGRAMLRDMLDGDR